MMLKKIFLLISVMLMTVMLLGQTQPTPQTLPYSQSFSDLAHATTTYPAGLQGWTVSTAPGAAFNTSAPMADRTLTANSTASTTSGNVHNYNGKIGFLNTGSLDLSIALALDTSGRENVTVVYNIMTIRNPYDGGSNTRINEVTLQYRIGTTGSFTTLTGVEYQNNTTTQNTAITTPQNLVNKVISLPAECWDQSIVQIRWISRQVSGAGARPSFAVDDIEVIGDPISNDPMINIVQTISSFATFVGIPSDTQTYYLSGSNLAQPIDVATFAPFEIRTSEGTWGQTLLLAADFSGNIEVRMNPSTAGTSTVPISHVSYDAESNPIIESFNVTGTATEITPIINITDNLQPFTTVLGYPSAPQSYTLTGLNLSEGISITAPTHFEISTDGGTTYVASGSVASNYNGLIYVRMTGTVAGSFSGNIVHSSAGATTINTAVTGIVNEPAGPAILLEENFDYADGSLLVNNGWTSHSGGDTNAPYVSSPGLTYPNYPLFSGLSAYLRSSGQDAHRTFTAATEGAVYASFLVNVESAGTTGDYFFHLGPDPISTTFRARVFVKSDASNNLAFGILKGSTTASTTWTGFDYALNTTYLVLVKYQIIPGDSNDEVFMWINPVFTGTEPAPQLTTTDSGSDISVASVALRQGTSANNVSSKIDGILISNNWDIHWQQTGVDGDIFVTGEVEPFVAIAGAPSERQFYNIQGSELTSNITVLAPAGFQLSETGNDPWTSTLTLPPTFSGDVFVRMYVMTSGLYAGDIVHTSGGADPVNFSVNGEAFDPMGEILVNEELVPFYATTSSSSGTQTYLLEGSELIGDIYVTASAPYQIRTSGSPDWLSTLQLAPDFNGTIEVQLPATTSGTYNGTITHESAETSNVVIDLTGSVTVGVADIAALRALETGTTVYTLTSEAVLSFQQVFRNQKYIQDTSAGILIDDFNGVLATVYNVGDGITGLTGTLGEYGGMKQFVPTRVGAPASSTGNVIAAQPITLSQLQTNFEDYESELVQVLGVSFTETGNFANGMMYTLGDGTTTFPFRTTFYDVDYVGTEIPTTAKDIIGIPNSRVTEGNLFTARMLSDFSDPIPVQATRLAVTTIDPASPYVNTAFSVSVQSLDDDLLPRSVTEDTQVTLSLNTGTGILSGTLTGTILSGTNSVVITGVLYNVVEAGVILTATATSGMVLLPANSSAITFVNLPATPTVTVLARPAQIDIAQANSQSAVLMQLQSYPTDDVRYRLYNGGNQYYCWDGTQYVSSTSYSAGPQPIGTPSTSAIWWIIFERGNNSSTLASYRDRQGPGYTSNYQTLALPAATAIADPFEINMTVPINPTRYELTNKYVALAYDQEVGGTLITATSTDLGTGYFSLKVENGTVIRRIEVRALDNTLMESLTGEWDGQGEDEYYADVEGLTGAALRAGLRTVTSTGQINNSWDNTRYHIYASLDNVTDTVTCVYTGEVYAHPAGGLFTPTGLSAEHTYPQEWFSGHAEQTLMETDLHALFPVNQAANSARSNYPYDYVTSITSTWGSGSIFSWGGLNSDSNNAFEVPDNFKGDAARALLYMSMRYYDDDSNLTQFSVPQLPVLLQWHALDPVSQTEQDRNDGKYAFQGNRNPFVDYPEWVSEIWGDITLATPVATAASSVGEHEFTATWDAVAGASSYRLDVSTTSTFTSFLNGYKNRVVSSTSQTVSALDPATVYYYRVRAISASEVSLHSNTITVNTTAGGTVSFYWNFNDNVPASGVNWTQPIPSQIGSGQITYNLTAAVSFAGTTINGEGAEVNGGSFCPQGGILEVENNGNYFELAMPTSGLEDIILSFATRRTSTGFNSQQVLYSLDGENFTEKTTFTGAMENNWLVSQIRSVDFSDVPGANNNPNFKVRIVLDGATSITGNNRFDNIKVFATLAGGTLSVPENVQISIQDSQVSITWDEVDGASSYRIEHSNDPYSGFTTAGTSATTSWQSPTNGMKFFRVVAVQ